MQAHTRMVCTRKKAHLFLYSNCSSLHALVLHEAARQSLNQSESLESLPWLNALSPWLAHHLGNSPWVTLGMNKSLFGNWSSFLGCREVSNVRMRKNIANSISQVPGYFSDQQSWLFVLINTKVVQLRTPFPLSFWVYIAFHIASQCK